jgi:hypothetical protein
VVIDGGGAVARVFVSYASADRECAGQLHEWLVAEGHEVFLDRDLGNGIAVGEEWGNRLLPVRAEPEVDHPLLPSAHYADLTVDSATARAALVEALRRVDAVGGFGWPDDKSPFPGLRPLDVDEHRMFFGRRSEVEQLGLDWTVTQVRHQLDGTGPGPGATRQKPGPGRSTQSRRLPGLPPTTETRSSLLRTIATPYATRLTGHIGNVKGVSRSGLSPHAAELVQLGGDAEGVRFGPPARN